MANYKISQIKTENEEISRKKAEITDIKQI